MSNSKRLASIAFALALAGTVWTFNTVAAAPADDTGKPATSDAKSTVCKFTNGPKAGTTHDYSDETALPIGAPCDDDADSTGVIIPKQ
jgi:hypothetical protein